MDPIALWRRLRGQPNGPTNTVGTPVSVRRCVVLQEGASTPSSDYLLRPHLARLGWPVVLADLRQPPGPDLPSPGDVVVVARYLDEPWRRALQARRESLAGLVYFMDDDLFDAAAHRALPAPYARKLHTLAARHRAWLEAQVDAFWVSTDALAAKYARLSPEVLPLAPPPELARPAAEVVRIAYHGTASHAAEIDWLHPVIAAVQARCAGTHVELFGEHPVHKQWRTLPRVAVMHPLGWEAYRAWTASHAADIGLAPLRPGAFNASRGAVKFFDYARMGAVGLYADVAPYRGFVRDGVDGVLLPPDDAAAWTEAIVALAGDPARRAALQAGVRARVDGISTSG